MPNIKSSKKAVKVIAKKTNAAHEYKARVKNSIKNCEKAIAANDLETAQKIVKDVQKNIDKAASKGLIKKNTANRQKSRLNEKVKNELEKAGFKVGVSRAGIDGKTPNNIVNRGLTKAGCQLEITRAQRALFFANKSLKSPRTKRSEILYKYAECLRNALND